MGGVTLWIINCILSFLFMIGSGGMLWAGEKEEMEALQKQLNKSVLEKPFSPGDAAALDAYLQEAVKNNTSPPQTQPPTGWQPGWTCNNLMYSLYQYRNCLHYYRYYGHYYLY